MSYGSSDQELYQEMSYAESGSGRLAFIRRTYAHLAGAVLAFIGLECLLLNMVPHDQVLRVFGGSPWSMLVLMMAYWGISWVANKWANTGADPSLQYFGLGLYIAVEALIFLPILIFAKDYCRDPNLITSAGLMTLFVFAGLTISVFVTGKDYSFLGPILSVGSMVAFGVILCAVLFGFTLGLVFSFAMIALLSGYILYETSGVMKHFPVDRHVAAALLLFSSVATLFYYILRVMMILGNRE